LDNRRGFLKSAGAGVAAPVLRSRTAASAAPLTQQAETVADCVNTWPIRYLFKSRTGFGNGAASRN